MTDYRERDYTLGTSEYSTQFWNMVRGRHNNEEIMKKGKDTYTGNYALPNDLNSKFSVAIKKESIFRNIATVMNAYAGSRIFVRQGKDTAAWVPEGDEIPINNSTDSLAVHPVDSHKLGVIVKLDSDFVYDATFNIEDYLTKRLAKCIAETEDNGFIHGDGVNMPTGILDAEKGAMVGAATTAIGFDDVIRLFFSLDKRYRKTAVWLMNDETALALRSLRCSDGQYLWNHNNDTIFGKPVVIANDMPSADEGAMPILFGDMSYYWIVCRSPVSLAVLKERFSLQNHIGYLAIEFLDGKLICREAVKGLKIGTVEAQGTQAG